MKKILMTAGMVGLALVIGLRIGISVNKSNTEKYMREAIIRANKQDEVVRQLEDYNKLKGTTLLIDGEPATKETLRELFK